MPYHGFRWLQPPGSDRWFGFFEGDKRAEVWAEGANGNYVAAWCWSVPDFKITGSIAGTGNDDADRYSAQVIAAHAFFDARDQT